MQIDWITVSAQIVNFLVLVWLLKRFLYQPVMRAMARREQRITDRLNEAETREREADDKARQFEEKSAALEKDRENILSEARENADQQRKQLLDEARAGVDEQRRQWQQQLEQEQQEFAEDLQRRTNDAVQHIARRALHDLADTELEERIVNAFIERLKSADDELRKALGRGESPVQIRTGFDLPSAVRGRLTRAVHEHVVADVELDYDHSEDLLCGIELRRGDHRLGWNLADYLDELAERVDEAFRPVEAGEQGG